ncbi:hypothetical protein ACE1OC_42775 (plasmid) [Streptomyces sp. DSM 116496]|uniref:hypothetical protein n=1 Tax=Streptomyces stoeckheimensis TaxID=3344656 RepID=UPI0038B37C87
MTSRRLAAGLLLAAAVPLTAAAAAAALRAGHLKLHANRHLIEITAQPRPNCPHCHGEGGWWTGGAFPEMEACGCWSARRELRIRLLPIPAWDEPPF